MNSSAAWQNWNDSTTRADRIKWRVAAERIEALEGGYTTLDETKANIQRMRDMAVWDTANSWRYRATADGLVLAYGVVSASRSENMAYPRVHPESLEGFIANHVPCSVRSFPYDGKVEHLVYDGMILWRVNPDDTRDRIRDFNFSLLNGVDHEGLSRDASFKLLQTKLPYTKLHPVFHTVVKMVRNEEGLYDGYDRDGDLLFTLAPEAAGRIIDAKFMAVEVVD